MKCSPISNPKHHDNDDNNNNNTSYHGGCVGEQDDHFETLMSFDNLNDHKESMVTTTCDSVEEDIINEGGNKVNENIDSMEEDDENNPPLTFLEKWLLDESTTSRQVTEEILRLPSMF